MTFVGFDLHKRHITACALDASGVVVAEIRQLTTTLAPVLATVLATMVEWLAALPAPITIAMEATLYWEWLVARLEQAGHRAHVADAYQVKLIWHARAKTDTVDSRKLAELLRTNLIPTIWVPDFETRRRRQLLRGRAFLVRERTRIKNRIHGHLTAERISGSRAAICMAKQAERGSRRSRCPLSWRLRRSAASICTMC
jgi:transposase